MKTQMKIALILSLLGFFQVNHAHAFAQRMPLYYQYDETKGQCFDQNGHENYYSQYLGECGSYQTQPGEDLKRYAIPIGLRGLHLKFGNLDGLILPSKDLSGIHISGVSLKKASLAHSVLEYSILDHVDLTNADLSGANLKHTTLVAVNTTGTKFTNAVFDETSFLPFSCKEAKAKGMIYGGRDSFYCDDQPPTSLTFSAGFQSRYPGVFALVRGDQSEIYLYHSDEFVVVPAESQSLSDDEEGDILCAAILGECLSRPDRLERKYAISTLPDTILRHGIEFYHEPIIDMENLGQARIVGFFNVVQDQESLNKIQIHQDQLFSDVIDDWKKLYHSPESATIPKVSLRSLLTDTQNLDYDPNWLDVFSTDVRRYCNLSSEKPGVNTVRCGLSLDYFPKPGTARGWAEQWMNNLIRKAQIQTLSLNLNLVKSVKNAFQTNFKQSINVSAINLTTITKQNYEKRRHFFYENQ